MDVVPLSARRSRAAVGAMAAFAALVAGAPEAADAQSLRGRIVDAGGVPVPGAVVELLDSASVVRARTLSDAAGGYVVTAAAAGVYRVQTRRIGFRPVLSDPIALATGAAATREIAVTGLPSRLDTVRVGGRNACGRASAASVATATVWEQVRTAIAATEISANAAGVTTVRVDYERQLDAVGWRTLAQTTDVRTEALSQPWKAPSPRSLHDLGYIVVGTDSTSYRAPGLDMLGSSTFIDDHCLRLTSGRDRNSIGVAFEPTPERRKLGGIRGTVYVDRATSELQEMEFRYTHGEVPDLADGARGSIEFARLKNGAWAISRWDIRMPVREIRVGSTGPRITSAGGAESRVVTTGVRVAGGELGLAVAGRDTLFSRPPLVLKGAVLDSATGRGLDGARVSLQGTALVATADRNGRFEMRGVLPGEYGLIVRTSALDSLGTANESSVTITDAKDAVSVRVPSAAQIVSSVCGPRRNSNGAIPGIVVGQAVGERDSPPPAGTTVSVEWTDAAGAPRSAALATDASGTFRLCGVPTGTVVVLRAAADSIRSDPQTVVLAPEQPVASVRLPLERVATATAVFSGVIVADSGREVVEDAEVIIADAALSVHSGARGAFRLRDVPVGTHRVVVRKLGFGPMETTLTFAANETVDRRIVLSRMTILNEVVITARDRRLTGFDENRARGIGTFFTRDFLETQEGRTLATVIGGTASVRLEYDRGVGPSRPNGGVYIASTRHCIPVFAGGVMTCAPCYAHVVVDGVVVTRFDRFDINSINPKDVEAIEYYRGPSEAPDRYQMADSKCGLVVIHTRLFQK